MNRITLRFHAVLPGLFLMACPIARVEGSDSLLD